MMKSGKHSGDHFKRGDLIDFVDGVLAPEVAEEIKAHIETCRACGDYVESLRMTFSALSADEVPEPSSGYWDYFEQRVRARAESTGAGRSAPRRRLILSWISGLAAAAALVILLWWLPEPTVPDFGEPGGTAPGGTAPGGTAPGRAAPGTQTAEVDAVDILLADLSTGEIIESMSETPALGLALIEDEAASVIELDAYLSETGSIYDLVDELDAHERESFISNLKATMEEDNTSAVPNRREGKGC